MNKLTILFIVILVTIGSSFLWLQIQTAPVNKNDTTKQFFVITPGAGIREIASKLNDQGLIKNSVAFFLLVKQKGIDSKIQAGDFRLSPSMSSLEIAQNLTHGSVDEWITIPEGKRADEVADLLEAKIPTFDSSWRIKLNKNEGYLFPDTYLIARDATIEQIISTMRNNFDTKYATLKKSTMSQTKIVILASLVEREARLSEDRPMVASVLLNRIELGMPLQIDATVQYVLGYQKNEKSWWKRALTYEDLKINSAYNTYTHPNLPPGPIASPGLSALQAIVNPADTNYIYYISDKSGKNHYATTLEQHNANIQRFGL